MKRDNYYVKRDDVLSSQNVKCECGHSVFLPAYNPVKICSYCGHYVFKNEKEKFKFLITRTAAVSVD